MKTHLIPFLLFFMLLTIPQKALAIKASPHPISITQPDGQSITVRLNGDEFHHFHTTEDGYLIRKNAKGYFVYSAIETEEIIARNPMNRSAREKTLLLNAVEANKTTLRKIRAAATSNSQAKANRAVNNGFPLTGTPKSLVILVNFTNKSFVVSSPKTAFSNLLNEANYSTNGGTGSARDYFTAASNGQFSPQFDVVGPYTLPQNMAYYGGNVSDEDKNPRQMVIDACKLADQNGVDFTQYDTDNDGIVDNVFIYYAGYNEAENGPEDTVWPHRWSLANYNTKYDGKSIFDYACTSELKGNSNSNMCGIGTFAHEFGHVLGLPDYYATDGSEHFTLDYWNIMDAGGYLNDGRTPPTYSAYDRFYLGWLQPVELKNAQAVILEPLQTSNKAYLITQNGNHNMNGENPTPTEFFMLENRQKTGWDAYLPGKGMLITRINYNATTWYNNGPNNNPSAMGVDIMEADGLATDKSMGGDPFPGTSNKTFYNPTLRNGTNINKPITAIKEENSIISFSFMGGAPTAGITTTGTVNQFSTTTGTASAFQALTINGTLLTNNMLINFNNNEHFEMKLSTESTWSKSLTLSPASGSINQIVHVRYNPQSAGTHQANLTISSTAVESKILALQGSSTAPYIPGTPYLSTGVIESSLVFPEIKVASSKTKILNLKTTDLIGNLTLTITGTNAAMFSVSASSVAKDNANAQSGTNINISYQPVAVGAHSAILTISGGGLPSKVIELSGKGL